MKLFLDCEFTDFQGELISLALVSEEGEEFYEVIPWLHCSKWVSANVVPVLNQDSIPKPHAQGKLQFFLEKYETIEIIADWPEDIAHFCNFLITAPGKRFNTPTTTMVIDRRLSSEASLIPHNALADARAIKEMYFGHETDSAPNN